MVITTNYERAVEVSRKAISMLEKKVFPFDQPDLFPDAIIPKGVKKGSYEHSLYLFHACSLDSMRESKSIYRRARELSSHLDFSEMHDLRTSCIEYFVHEYFEKPKATNKKRKVMGDPVRTLSENSKVLYKKYDNDPRRLKADTVEKTIKNIVQFRQYGAQKAALLLKNMVRAGIWKFPYEQMNIKIDRHVINISLGAGVICLPEDLTEIRFNKLVTPLNQIYQKVIKEKNISAINLNDAFWVIGQYLCTPRILANCKMNCKINCKIKPYTDKQYTVLELKRETRERTESLFDNS